MDSKNCPCCKEHLPIERFGTFISGPNGKRSVDSYCQKCKTANKRKRRQANRETKQVAVRGSVKSVEAAIETHKTCLLCEKVKSVDEFRTNPKGQRRYYKSYCKSCQNRYNESRRARKGPTEKRKVYLEARNVYLRISQYGITRQQLNQLYERQERCCRICGRHESESARKKLHIDHCHTTGVVRGLLCGQCNVSLGLLKENVDTLSKMIDYIQNAPKSLSELFSDN